MMMFDLLSFDSGFLLMILMMLQEMVVRIPLLMLMMCKEKICLGGCHGGCHSHFMHVTTSILVAAGTCVEA